jgi:hypothetical protein
MTISTPAKLPPMLQQSFLDFRNECRAAGQPQNDYVDSMIYVGYGLCWKDLKPLFEASHKYLDAMARHTQIKQADGGVLLLLAEIGELVAHGD